MPLQAGYQGFKRDTATRKVAQVFMHRDPRLADGTQMTDAIRRVVARQTGVEPRLAAFPWWLLTLASPFVTTFREMREMRHLWRNPLRMDNARLVFVLGREPHTPLDEAVEATLVGLGCLLQDLAQSLQR
jgi:nucleoside-diphosphate-sugar epimerase